MGAVSEQPAVSFYDAVGGAETFRFLVARFYAGVATDPELRPLYPEPDLSGAQERLRMFWFSTGAARAPTANCGDILGSGCGMLALPSSRRSGTPGCGTCAPL